MSECNCFILTYFQTAPLARCTSATAQSTSRIAGQLNFNPNRRGSEETTNKILPKKKKI
jgi:hypothetical protein